jgi:short-subunit dehydrogenase
VESKKRPVAVVTGAGRGIGAGIASALAKQGYALVLVSRTLSELNETIKTISRDCSVPFKILAGDVAQKETILKIESAVQKMGGWQVLINNAGICEQAEIKNMTDTSFEKMLAVNVTAVFKLCRLALNKMNAEGVIVNIASVSGVYGVSKFKGLGPYAATKAAVIALTEMIAQEGNLDGKNIFGYCISPGAVETKMLKSIVPVDYEAELKPEDIAKKVIQLIQNRPQDLNGKNMSIWNKQA